MFTTSLCVLALTVSDGHFSEELEWGPHPVGFRSSVELDPSRQYVTAFDDGATYGGDRKRPRPLLVNVWYPANSDEAATSLPYHRYLQLDGDDEAINRWTQGLSDFAADVIAGELFGKSVKEMDGFEQGLWKEFLDRPTRSLEEAEPLAGPFPVVVYHSGAGSSFEDNSVLCENLASHGYVVLGSAYPKVDGTRYGVDGKEGSVRDMEALARFAAGLPFADWRRMAFGGHSLGAQVCLQAMARPDCPANTMFLLDSTVDYYSLEIPTYRNVTDQVLDNRKHFHRPILIAAGPEATFQLADQLVHAERTYLTAPKLGHNEYIAQGMQRLEILERLQAKRPDEGRAKELSGAPEVRQRYAELCHLLRLYLDKHLKGEPRPYAEASRSVLSTALGEGLAMIVAPVGNSGAPPYSEEQLGPLTPRQIMSFVEQTPIEQVIAVLDESREESPNNPVYWSPMIMGSLLYELVQDDRLADAQQLHERAMEFPVNGVWNLGFLALMSQYGGRLDRARHFLEIAEQIAPEDSGTASKLEALEKLEAAERAAEE